MHFAIFSFGKITELVPLISVVFLLGACAPVQDDVTAPGVEQIYRLPWPDASGEYAMKDVSLSTFQEPDKLRGSVAEIIVDPRVVGIVAGETSGSIEGQEPIGRWLYSGSRRTPADFLTLQAATVYAHLEKLSVIDRSTGVSQFLKGRARIGVASRISDGSATIMVNNAVYDGRLDTLFMVPYTPPSGLAISLNGAIIAHEHFHRIFQARILAAVRKAVSAGQIPSMFSDTRACSWVDHAVFESSHAPAFEGSNSAVTPKVLNEALVRAVNEGLADFWGWAYTRDDRFVARSLSESENEARRLDKPVAIIPSKESLRANLVFVTKSGRPLLKSEANRIGASYRFGTEYARILRGFVEALVKDANVDREQAVTQVRLAVANSLPQIAQAIIAGAAKELEPELLLKPIVTNLLKMSPSGPAVLDASSASVICRELTRLQASSEMKSGLCGDLERMSERAP